MDANNQRRLTIEAPAAMHADLMHALAEAQGMVSGLSRTPGTTTVVAVVPGEHADAFLNWFSTASNGEGRVHDSDEH